jgi:hypothetical protein
MLTAAAALKSIGAFWYDFVIGDDWRVAAVVAAALALTVLLVRAAGMNAWWLLPVCVFAVTAPGSRSRRPRPLGAGIFQPEISGLAQPRGRRE